jgi:vesicular inhibitory amino acid transporter
LPSFESVMALLGSGFALVTVVIIPIWAGAEVFGWTWYAMVTCGVSAVVAVVGIVTSFWPSQAGVPAS